MRSRWLWLSIVGIFITIFFQGRIQNQPIDQLSLTFGAAYDLTEDGKIQSTVTVPSYEKNQGVHSTIFTNSSHTHRGIRYLRSFQDYKIHAPGKIMLMLLGEKLAKSKSAIPLINSYQNDPRIGNVQLAVVEGTADRVFKEVRKKDSEEIASSIKTMILNNNDVGLLPKSSLHVFLYKYEDNRSDPFLPLLTVDNQKVCIKGLALFKGGAMVDTLPKEKVTTFMMLYQNNQQALKEFSIDKGEYAYYSNEQSTIRYTLKKNLKKPVISILLTMQGTVPESTEKDLNQIALSKLEERLSKQMKQEGDMILSQFQKKGIDPLGIGDKLHWQVRNWENAWWKQFYPTAEIQLNVTVKLNDRNIY